MKIGIVTEYYYPLLGGITEHVHHFYLEAKKLGHDPVILTSDAGKDKNVDMSKINIIHIGKSLPIYSNGSIARVTVGFNLGKKVKEVLVSEKFDILHIHSPFIPMLPMLFQRYSDVPTVGTFHTHFNSSGFLRLLKPGAKKYFEGLDGRIAVSHLCVESMNRYFKGDYRIIPNGVDTAKFSPSVEKIPEFSDGKMNIFFLSRLEPRNGLEFLINAFSKIRRQRNDCRLIIGGDGPLKQYFKYLVPSDVKDDVHFLGRINGVRPNYYSTADIFCFPTTKASFGITILEAMSAAKPVVAFTMPAYEAIMRSGEDGILCGEPDSTNLAIALMKLLDSKDERIRIGANARAKAEEYAWPKVAKEVIGYYEEILGQK